MSRRNVLPVLYTLLSIGLILLTAWSLDHFRRYQPYASLLAQNDLSPRQFALQLNDVELSGRSGGKPQWSVHARRIQLTPDQSSIVIDSLERGVLMRSAKPYLQFVASRVLYALGGTSNTSGTIDVSGGIRIASVGPASPLNAPIAISTSRAQWNGYRSTLTLPDRVQVSFQHTPKDPGIALDSEGATWNASNSQLVCPARVHAAVDSLGSYGPYQVESTGLLYDEPSGQVRCANPISVSVPALGSATCRPLVVDTHQHTSDFGQVKIVADAPAILTPMPTPAPPTTQKPGAKLPDDTDDNTVTVDAPGGGHWDEQTKTLPVKGPVTFHQGDAAMSTVGAIYDRKSDIAKGLSPVTITDPETTVTGDQGSVDFKHHIANLTGHIHIDVEPKPEKAADPDDTSGEGEARQPSVLTCDAVDYDYRKKFAITKGTVVIKQKHRTVTADQGTYDTVKHIADLTGHVVADSDDGQHMEADHAKISLKKGDEWIDIPHPNVYKFKVEDEDNPKTAK